MSDFRGFNAQAKSCLMRVSSAMKLDPTNMQRNHEAQVEKIEPDDVETNPDGAGEAD